MFYKLDPSKRYLVVAPGASREDVNALQSYLNRFTTCEPAPPVQVTPLDVRFIEIGEKASPERPASGASYETLLENYRELVNDLVALVGAEFPHAKQVRDIVKPHAVGLKMWPYWTGELQ